MQFLSSLGIDGNLLIAQIVNFVLLLWILSRFVYGPIIRRIEKDEAALRAARQAKEELEHERITFADSMKKDWETAKARAEAVINEAESVASELKRQAREDASREAKKIVATSETKIQMESESITSATRSAYRKEIFERFQHEYADHILPERREALDSAYIDLMLTELDRLPLNLHALGLEGALKDMERLKNEHLGDATYMSELSTLIQKKLGPVILTTAVPLSDARKQQCLVAISRKLGTEIAAETVVDPALIAGCRLEVAGTVIEANIGKILYDASTA